MAVELVCSYWAGLWK